MKIKLNKTLEIVQNTYNCFNIHIVAFTTQYMKIHIKQCGHRFALQLVVVEYFIVMDVLYSNSIINHCKPKIILSGDVVLS